MVGVLNGAKSNGAIAAAAEYLGPVVGGAAGAVATDGGVAGTRAIVGKDDSSFDPVASAKSGALGGAAVKAGGKFLEKAFAKPMQRMDNATKGKLAEGAAKWGAISSQTLPAINTVIRSCAGQKPCPNSK